MAAGASMCGSDFVWPKKKTRSTVIGEAGGVDCGKTACVDWWYVGTFCLLSGGLVRTYILDACVERWVMRACLGSQ